MIFKDQCYSCNGCPCLNTDGEEGGSCNLGYECRLRWNEQRGLSYTSKDCGLISVKYVGSHGIEEEFVCSGIDGYTVTHPDRWDV